MIEYGGGTSGGGVEGYVVRESGVGGEEVVGRDEGSLV